MASGIEQAYRTAMGMCIDAMYSIQRLNGKHALDELRAAIRTIEAGPAPRKRWPPRNAMEDAMRRPMTEIRTIAIAMLVIGALLLISHKLAGDEHPAFQSTQDDLHSWCGHPDCGADPWASKRANR